MSSSRLGACVAASLWLVSCAGSGEPRTTDAPLPPSGSDAVTDPVNDRVLEVRPEAATETTRDVAADQILCPPGASEADCRLCGATGFGSCERVCPMLDCTGDPPPVECIDVCAGGSCCACLPRVIDYVWQVPFERRQCGTPCGDMLSRWEGYLADPAMVACKVASDCTVVGGQPRNDPCNGRSTIGYCGRAVNAAAYAASPAPGLETEFAATCPDHKAYDCGPAAYGCIDGKCTIGGWGCCNCPLPDASPDLPMSRLDAAWETREEGGFDVMGGEAGAGSAGAGEAGTAEAGSSEAGGR